eukprot:4759565-Prymnesium_polylepis.1
MDIILARGHTGLKCETCPRALRCWRGVERMLAGGSPALAGWLTGYSGGFRRFRPRGLAVTGAVGSTYMADDVARGRCRALRAPC